MGMLHNAYIRTLKVIVLFLFFASEIVAQHSSGFIERVQNYQNSVKIIHNGNFPDVIDTSTFNLNTYLQFFDKLSFPKGLKCDYVFWDADMAGYPIIYVKKDSFKMERYLKKKSKEYDRKNKIEKKKITPRLIQFHNNYIISEFAKNNKASQYVMPEDNEEGYLQYLFFNLLGNNFVLKWHSNYGESSIIFSGDEMKRLYNYYSKTDDYSCNMNDFAKLLEINPSPVIEIKNDKCVVTWYEIRTHFGIHKMKFEIGRSSPYAIEKKEDILLLKINMDFIY